MHSTSVVSIASIIFSTTPFIIQQDMSKTLIVILGPTGVGKTELCLRIAEHLGVPIINADSRQIFAELPIGTAAPTYSASMYEEQVMSLLTNELFAASDTAVMSGGSMMYIDAVCNGIDDIPTIDDTTRQWMKQRLEQEGLPKLVEELKILDPEHWAIVDRNNPRRVVHALEICHMTGTTYTSFRQNEKKQRPFNILKIGLTRDREELYSRINNRVLQMIDDGLEQEALAVYDQRHLNSLNTVGYKEMFEYLDGLTTLDQAIFKIQSNSRRYCRKQLTWFKRDESISWFNPDNIKEIINYIDEKLKE